MEKPNRLPRLRARSKLWSARPEQILPRSRVKWATDSSGNLQFFQNANTALSALSFPQGGNVGDRNALTGPGFWNVDMGVAKFFAVPWSERQRLQFRWDSFNTFNHPSFNPPNPTLLNTSSFGFIGSTSSTPRVMQLALRFEF